VLAARFASNTTVPEAPAEVLEAPRGLLSRTRESDAGPLAHAVGASLDHLRQWLSWATEEAADVQAQRRRCREAETRWHDGRGYSYVLRPQQSGQVIGSFDLWRIGLGAVELGYWIHVDFTGRGYATACARVLTTAGLALSGVERVDDVVPEAPAHSGRQQIWVMQTATQSPQGQDPADP